MKMDFKQWSHLINPMLYQPDREILTEREREKYRHGGGGAAAAAHRLEPDLDQNLQSPSGHRTRDQLQPNEASSAPELALPCLVTMDTTTSGAHCLSKRGGGGGSKRIIMARPPLPPSRRVRDLYEAFRKSALDADVSQRNYPQFRET